MPATLESRIKTIQEILKVSQTGQFDLATCKAYEALKKLSIASAELIELKKGIQISLGFSGKDIDGDVGPNTISRIEKNLITTSPTDVVAPHKINANLKETVTIQNLKDTIAALGYKWFEDQPNIIGVRATLQKEDKFNDFLFMVYKKNGEEQLFAATITTDPGVVSQKRPVNEEGCWVMMPNQMLDAYEVGLHHPNKLPPHRALRSVGRIYGYRENDRDGILLNDQAAIAKAGWGKGSLIWANIHGTKKETPEAEKVGSWSAGCQVHSNWEKKEEMMDIVDTFKSVNKGLFTYTLVREVDLKI